MHMSIYTNINGKFYKYLKIYLLKFFKNKNIDTDGVKMSHLEVASQYPSILGINSFESVFEAIIDFFKDIKDIIVSNNVQKIKNDVGDNFEIFSESYKNVILSNFDLMINISKDLENKKEKDMPKDSYFLIRIKDIFSYVLFEENITVEEVDLLLEIFTLYKNLLFVWK